MDLSAKNDAYKSYIEQAKEAYSNGDVKRARSLFLKAAEITNEITLLSTNVDIKQEYYQVTQTIMQFVKKNCVTEVRQSNENHPKPSNQNLDITTNEDVSLEQALQNLQELIGLENVKRTVTDWVKQLEVFQKRKQNGLKVPQMTYHLVFTGKPGTGKTTVARIVSQIYRAIGLLPKGHLVEVSRSDVVAGYVGQTAITMQKVVEQSLGGVLFIDEAYLLAKGGENDFGKEAIGTLIKLMDDKRDQFAVIVAGYEEEMNQFIESNQGIRSRFKTTIHF